MNISQVHRLKELEEENRKLKQIYADLALDNKIMKDVIEKKVIVPEQKKEIVSELVEEYDIIVTRACLLMMIHRSSFYYLAKKDDSEVVDALREASEFGDDFWKIFRRLRNQGRQWNQKKVYRVYKSMCYNKRIRLRKRLPARVKEPLITLVVPNHTWSMDFVSDSLSSGRKYRVLNIIGEAVTQEMSMSMPTERAISILERVNGAVASHRQFVAIMV